MPWAGKLALACGLAGLVIGLRFGLPRDAARQRRIGAFLVLAVIGLALVAGGG